MGCVSSKSDVSYEPVTRVQLRTKSDYTKESNPDLEMILKIVVLGDSGVGKTSMLQRLTEGSYMDSQPSTVGVDFKSFNLEINARTIPVTLWDTAGQERFRAVTQSYYRGMNVAILVYDVSNSESFSRLAFWMQECQKQPNPDCQIVIVGCKTDKESCVNEEDVAALQEIVGKHQHIQVCAKTGANFSQLIRVLGTAAQNVLLLRLAEADNRH